MSLIALLVVIILCGLIYWVITQLPIDALFKKIALVVIVVLLVIYLLSALGLLSDFNLYIPRAHTGLIKPWT